MDFLSTNIHLIYTLVYIAVIILGGAALMLILILSAKKRDAQHKAVLIFISSIFFYMIIDFTTYYFLTETSAGKLIFLFITLSDTLFCIMVTAWVYLIMVLANIKEVISNKLLIIISAVYLICSQILSIYLGRYSSYTIQVDGGPWNIILQILNASYDIGIIIIGIRCIVFLYKKYAKGSSRNLNLLMTSLLIGYMLWILYWDYSTWFKTEANLLEIYALDPLILLYAILNIFLIYYFYKKDPLKITESSISPIDAIGIISNQYSISEREREVIELVYQGLSNKQIADRLFISENTVKRHMNHIFKKTQTKSRQDIIHKISQIH